MPRPRIWRSSSPASPTAPRTRPPSANRWSTTDRATPTTRRRLLGYTNSGLVEQIDVPALLVVQDALANFQNWQPWSIYKGLTWAYTDAWERHVYSHLLPPNAPPVTTYYTNTFRCLEGDSAMDPTSNHPGGVNVSFMDGSVHFIKNSVSLQTWWSMGTRGRGEIISADSY